MRRSSPFSVMKKTNCQKSAMGKTDEGSNKAINNLFWPITKQQSGREPVTIVNMHVHKQHSRFKNKLPPNNHIILPSPRKTFIIIDINNAMAKCILDDNRGYRWWQRRTTKNNNTNGNEKCSHPPQSLKFTIKDSALPVGVQTTRAYANFIVSFSSSSLLFRTKIKYFRCPIVKTGRISSRMTTGQK